MNKLGKDGALDPKHILIISYTFPPAEGIGGRRWAKFAKYLVTKGYIVHVLTANQSTTSSSWRTDVQKENIYVYKLPIRYPKVLLEIPHSFYQKVLYKIWLILFKLYSKGTTIDRSMFWKKALIKKSLFNDVLLHVQGHSAQPLSIKKLTILANLKDFHMRSFAY